MKAKIEIGEAMARRLLQGKYVFVNLPPSSTQLQIRMKDPGERNWLAEIMDVFFNGRKAR